MPSALNRNSFRKALATAEGRKGMGLDLTAEQAAAILADDQLTDSWYRKVSTAPAAKQPILVEPPPPAPPVQKATMPPKHEPTTGRPSQDTARIGRKAGAWLKATTQKQRIIAASIVVASLVVTFGAVSISVSIADAEVAAEALLEEQRIAAGVAERAAFDAEQKAQAAVRAKERAAEERNKEVQALKNAPTRIAEIDAAVTSAPWAAEEPLQIITDLRAKLSDALQRKDGQTAHSLNLRVPAAIEALGTLEDSLAAIEDSLDRDFDAEFEAVAGRKASDDDREQAREWCRSTATDLSGPEGPDAWATAAVDLKFAFGWKSPALAVYCPELQKVAATFIGAGNHRVGGDGIAPGTYATLTGVSDCYWERHTLNGDILDNDFITAAPDGVIVTVYDNEGFSNSHCGLWRRTG